MTLRTPRGMMRGVKLRAPADVFLRRAQVVLLLSVLCSTVLTTPIGVVLLVSGGEANVSLIAGILVLSFCASSLAGFMLGAILLRRGASLVRNQSQFLSSVSHELRTPMTSIRMFVEALLDDRLTDPEERHRCLSILRREVVRLDGLVDRLIELSRIEGATQPFARVPTDVGPICHAAVDAIAAIDLSRPTNIALDVQPDLRVVGDASALTQAIVNLLSNAWKYTGDDKQIALKAHATGDRLVEFEVSDNGPGIPLSEQKLVFEKFTRGKAGDRVGGSGLGLAIVKAIVAAHRGSIEVESTPGKGARFRFRIPRAPHDGDA
ncbi:MAG: sensor histidine kinase [Planctomycetes bacterium]|nr:sensor histidine kinase [Planctomycetota bacterium]